MSSEPSSLLERMVEDLGGWAAVRGLPPPERVHDEAPEATRTLIVGPPTEPPVIDPPDVAPGTVVLDRYVLGEPLGRPGLRLFLAHDRTTRQPVTVQLLAVEGRRDALMAGLRLGRSVVHRSILRIHDVATTPWGALVVMEAGSIRSLAELIARRRPHGGMSVEEIRRIGAGVAAPLAAIHAQGLVHGCVEPATIFLVDGAPRLLASILRSEDGAAIEAAREPPSAYHSPERLRGAGPSPCDDLYGLGMTLWSLSAKAEPAPGQDVRGSKLGSDAHHAEIARLTPDELRQMYAALSPVPSERPPARLYRFFDARYSSPTLLQSHNDRLFPGAPVAIGDGRFPHTMSLLVTFAATAPELVGSLLPLRKPISSLGRDPHADVALRDETVSNAHATLVWRKGMWIVSDRRSTNGTYADPSYQRQADVRLRHGGEVQFGELRVRLVAFEPGSEEHRAAQRYLTRHDGLTGLLAAPSLFDALRAEQGFAEWGDLSLHLAVFEVRLQQRGERERLSVLELLVLRRLARRVTELTDALLVNLRTATIGLVPSRDESGKGSFSAPSIVVAWVGVTAAQAHTLLDTMLAELRPLIPPGLLLRATVVPLPRQSDPAAIVENAVRRS